MGASSGNVHSFYERLRLMLADDSGIDFRDFEEVSVALLNGYARFSRQGMPDHTIVHAMMDATINCHRLFGTHSELPQLLRHFADRIERENSQA